MRVDLHQLCASSAFGRILPPDDVSRCANELELSIPQTLDCIALEIANKFHAGRLDFSFYDKVVNVLLAWSLVHCAPLGNMLIEVYLAFDKAEDGHGDDDDDPI